MMAGSYFTGAFYKGNTFGSHAAMIDKNVGNTANDFGINASRCSNIYGSSNTVTPLSLSCKYIIRH